ncbi:hypothetical protein WJX72_001319 [[Myrmecia] bisecta]|uniref:Protein-glucosylgalactosylhydroxylysine glucosidase n=1 Tax=[Myrmecia] bisecta TaxID=41462 RepID=A0AAW1QPT3_9CHLO
MLSSSASRVVGRGLIQWTECTCSCSSGIMAAGVCWSPAIYTCVVLLAAVTSLTTAPTHAAPAYQAFLHFDQPSSPHQAVPAPTEHCIPDADLLCAPHTADLHFPPVGNGYLATVVGSDTVYVAGVYNGRAAQQDTSTHRARIPAMAAFSINGLEPIELSLDLQRAVVKQHSRLADYDVSAVQSWYAHRARPSLLIHEAQFSTGAQAVDLSLQNHPGPPSPDFAITPPQPVSFPAGDAANATLTVGLTTEPEQQFGPSVTVAIVTTVLPADFLLPRNTQRTVLSITAIRTSLDAADPAQAALDDYAAAWAQRDSLAAQHEAAWATLWQHSVEVEGDVDLAQKVRSSWYYLLSSIRAEVPHSLSPGGLATDGFGGHVFWDTEVWMFPNLALFHPDLAKSCLEYRFHRMEQAQAKAARFGFQGAMFPWESASTGAEATMAKFSTGLYEHHISADISLAVKWLWELTRDREWLASVGAPLALQVAQFWESRAEWRLRWTRQCDINAVTGPDEYHERVDNSVYTNVAARMALQFAAHVHTELLDRGPAPLGWAEVADALAVTFDPFRRRHPEYKGYQGETIKQADVVLLSYPLQWPMPLDIQANDLRYYEERTDAHGPAMTWSMATVAWLRLNDIQKATDMFRRSFDHMLGPFHLWSEIAGGGGTPHFITGAGGWLQSLWAGYAGIRFNEQGLFFHLQQQLPPGATRLTLRGLSYVGHQINVSYDAANVVVTLTHEPALSSQGLWLHFEGRQGADIAHVLRVGEPLEFPLQPFAIATSMLAPTLQIQDPRVDAKYTWAHWLQSSFL